MKCLIIVIQYQRSLVDNFAETAKKNYNYAFPIGYGYIAAVLKQHNHQVKVLNLNHVEGSVETLIKEELQKDSYDCVLSGGLSPFFPNVRTIVTSVRKYAPKTKIILGGGLVSSQPEIIFKMLEPDFGVIGEGEETVAELVNCLQNNGNPSGINGIIFRDSEEKICITNPRFPIKNLDSLPWPDYEILGFETYLDHMHPSSTAYYDVFDYPRVYPIVASRSCPYACTFCFHPLGNKYRQRSVEDIMNEIKNVVVKYRINILEFYDELFAQNPERVTELCKNIKEFASTLPWELKWVAAMRVDCLDEDVIKEMKEAGCFFISLGLESYSPVVLKSMKKRITPEQIDRALHLCRRVGISVQGNFIFGDIAETTETYRESLEYWKSHRDLCEGSIGLTHIVIYQGSYIYKYALKKGIIKDEFAFIEERAKKIDSYFEPLNITEGMTDKEYQQMLVDFKEAQIVCKNYAIPIRHIQTENAHELEVRCPFCGSVTVYRNYHLPLDFERIGISCRHCRARYIVASKKLRMKFLMFRIFGFKLPYVVAKAVYDYSEHLPGPVRHRIKKLLAG